MTKLNLYYSTIKLFHKYSKILLLNFLIIFFFFYLNFYLNKSYVSKINFFQNIKYSIMLNMQFKDEYQEINISELKNLDSNNNLYKNLIYRMNLQKEFLLNENDKKNNIHLDINFIQSEYKGFLVIKSNNKNDLLFFYKEYVKNLNNILKKDLLDIVISAQENTEDYRSKEYLDYIINYIKKNSENIVIFENPNKIYIKEDKFFNNLRFLTFILTYFTLTFSLITIFNYKKLTN